MSIKNGDKIRVKYEGTLEDGTVFDSSEIHDEPLEFVVGDGHVFQVFEKAVIGMKIGDEKRITLQPQEAYGEYNSELIRVIPNEQFPEKEGAISGMKLMMSMPDGSHIPAEILEMSNDTVTVDMNHPLSGKTLNFNVKVVDVHA